MAPKRYAGKLKPYETASLKGLWRVGVFTKEQMKEHFKINNTRLKQLENSRFIKVYEEKVYIDRKGIKECEKRGMQHRYSSNFKNFAHDTKLSKVYLSLQEKNERGRLDFKGTEEKRDRWITEKALQEKASQSAKYEEFRDRMTEKHDKGKFQATPDAGYMVEKGGEVGIIGIEITTDNYSDQDIEQKVEFSREFLDGIHVY